MSKVLLRVSDLRITIPTKTDRQFHPVDGVSFEVAAGQAVGLLGESGSGKTTLARSLLRLLPSSSRVDGSIEFEGLPLLSLGAKALRRVRGARLSLIHQDPSALNPVRRVGEQLVDVLRAHQPWSSRRCREEALSLLQQMDFEDASRIYAAYPQQLSGGEQQRIVVAQALICQPALVIADEATASVDCDTATQILQVFGRRKIAQGTSFIVISHDVQVLARSTDTLMVICSGRIVESGPTENVLAEPKHAYTRALVECSDLTGFDRRSRPGKLRLPTIAGRFRASFDTPIGASSEDALTDLQRYDEFSLRRSAY